MSSSVLAHFLEIHAASAGLAAPVPHGGEGFVLQLHEGIVVRVACRRDQVVLMGSPGAFAADRIAARRVSAYLVGDKDEEIATAGDPDVLAPCATHWVCVKQQTQATEHGAIRIRVSADPADGMAAVVVAAPLNELNADALDRWVSSFQEAYVECAQELGGPDARE